MQCGRVGSRLLLLGAPRIQCSRGSFFVPALFPSLLSVKSPLRKFPSCTLQETVFLSTLIGSCHPLFIHLQRKRHSCPCCLPCNLHPIPLAFWCRKPGYLTQIVMWLDADCNVTWRRLRHDLRQVRSWYGTGWNVMCCKSRGGAYVLYLWCGDFVVLFVID